MGLPLLFGIIAYLLIILFMSIWLTKYHAKHCWVPHHDQQMSEEEYLRCKHLKSEANIPTQESPTSNLSGNQSSTTEPKEVFHRKK